MKSIVLQSSDTYPVAVLVKGSAFDSRQVRTNYLDPLIQAGVLKRDLIAIALPYNDAGKAPAKFIKEQLEGMLPNLASLGTRYLYVGDSAYFKTLTGSSKAEPHIGYALPCKIKGYEHLQVVLGINHLALIYNPELQSKLDLTLNTLASLVNGSYRAPGSGIIHSAHYPKSLQEIAQSLQELLKQPSLEADIEAFSLRHHKAGIGSIAFAWNQHEGVAFAVDYVEYPPDSEEHKSGLFGYKAKNTAVRALLREFFEQYQGELTFHGGSYDLKVIIYNLWMADHLDTPGLLEGLEVMTRHYHDTKIIAYLATNSTAGNVLGLKPLAHEFAGNWAVEEIKDIRRIPLPKLLQYNLVDALCTHYVRKKYYPIMVQDQQEELYFNLMLPSQKLIIQLELTGMPLSPQKVAEVRGELEAIRDGHIDVISNSAEVRALNHRLQHDAMVKANAKLKTKQHPITKFSGVVFNPNSGPQLQILLYEQLQLPVIDLTDTKMPATGAETLDKLINHATQQSHKDLLAALIGYGKATKILSTFIPAFEEAVKTDENIAWLHGCFNLGGTVSGRLSSSDPNLQNLPANSIYGKLIKECFVAPAGWIFAGADFNSLEDYISALTTKDPNKLNVYVKGFDGHCLRAAYYFRDQVPHIDLDDPKSVNSLKKTHPELRQDSKAPTFLLTYGGTYHGMMSNLGWPEAKAKEIEKGYHDLYQVSDQYVQSRLAQASKDGYVAVAFGLRVRTPLLAQVVWGGPRMPYEAAAEGRTAGNALGQSYNLLNNRAAVEFFQKVWASKYRYDIKPVALIHDAIYILIRDDVEVVEWANRELIQSMRWQELPEIQHPTVKLGAALDLFWPSWAKATTLPNDADRATILEMCKATKQELNPEKAMT